MQNLVPSDFSSSNSTRKSKRPRRASRPCDACRTRKTRCVANARGDNCVHCDLRGTVCQHLHRPLTRRQRPSDSPSQTAHSASQASDVLGGAQVKEHSRTAPSHGGQRLQSTSQQPVQDGHDGEEPVISAPPQVATCESLGPPPSRECGTSSSLGFARGRFAELYGPGSDMEPILMRHRPYDSANHEYRLETHSIRKVADQPLGYPLTYHIADDSKASSYAEGYDKVDAIEQCVQPNGHRILNLYFTHVHPAYPILHPTRLLEAYERSYRFVCPSLLGVMYLIAMKWWSFDAELSIKPFPDVKRLRTLVTDAVQQAYHAPKLSSIQAALLLLQCQPEDPLNPGHTFSAGLTAQAIAVGQCLGLHLDPSVWLVPKWERGVRKRLSWALYMQDRWTALAYGRPMQINEEDWELAELDPSDFEDRLPIEDSADPHYNADFIVEPRTSTRTGHLQFMQMAHLARLLSRILSTYYTKSGAHEQDTVKLFETARPVWQELQAFRTQLPQCLSLEVKYHRQLSFHGQLWFSYYAVCIALLRRLVRSTALPPACIDEQTLAIIRQNALQTAQDATTLVYDLRPDHLESFWYFNGPYLFSLLGSFCTLLLVTSLSTHERTFWQESLNSYLWHLRTMSKGSDAMRYAVNRLEGAILRGLEHALAVNLTDTWQTAVSPLVAQQNQGLEFADFGHWDLANEDMGLIDFFGTDALGNGGL